jgi:ABC-type transport system substrate-binding protein
MARWLARLVCALALCGACARADIIAPGHQHYFGSTERIRGFDPVTASDTSAIAAICKVYEGLYEYEYLVRPYELKPMLADGMPEISPDRLTYTIRIKKGVRFADDPCFPTGKGRELVAEDFVYSIKRLADVKNLSPRFYNLEGRIVGLDEYRAESGQRRVSYDEPVEGLKALDRYTIQIKLKEPFPQLLYALTQSETFPVPREAVEYYGKEFLNHPVGTGPFRLSNWRWRNYAIEFERNPTYHGDTYPTRGAPGDRERGLLDDAGKPLPLLDRVTQYVIADDSTEWLMFLSGKLAASGISRQNFDAVITPQKELTPELKRRGIWLDKSPRLATFYVGYNMEDPVVGPNQKLRQAMACAVDLGKWVRFYNDRQLAAKGLLPPGVPGHGFDLPHPFAFDPARARRLMAEAGYPGGIDPKTGRRLTLAIELPSAADVEERQSIELLASFWEQIGIELRPTFNNWPEFLKKLERKQCQMYRVGWVVDAPDAYYFLLLFYSKNISPGPNNSNYSSAEFDRMFEQARVMDDSPERTALYRKMEALVVEDCSCIFLTHPLSYGLFQPALKNFKYHDRPYSNIKFYRMGRMEGWKTGKVP